MIPNRRDTRTECASPISGVRQYAHSLYIVNKEDGIMDLCGPVGSVVSVVYLVRGQLLLQFIPFYVARCVTIWRIVTLSTTAITRTILLCIPIRTLLRLTRLFMDHAPEFGSKCSITILAPPFIFILYFLTRNIRIRIAIFDKVTRASALCTYIVCCPNLHFECICMKLT